MLSGVIPKQSCSEVFARSPPDTYQHTYYSKMGPEKCSMLLVTSNFNLIQNSAVHLQTTWRKMLHQTSGPSRNLQILITKAQSGRLVSSTKLLDPVGAWTCARYQGMAGARNICSHLASCLVLVRRLQAATCTYPPL